MVPKIYVTQPSLPPLDKYHDLLEDIWKSKLVTNGGKYHQQLEKEIAQYLNVPYVSLFNNGTTALQVALSALRITGEVITTPYSFVATAHALKWNNCTPVFTDIDPTTCNLDPQKIEALITPQTTAILPVHVYGTPCKMEEIEHIADIYGLRVIYDAAHAFGVKKNGKSVLNTGDISMVSFHATKAFNTVEGGLLVMKTEGIKQRIDYLKNFGFENEETVIGIGTNGKMNELIAAYGLLQLQEIDNNINKRKILSDRYRDRLGNIRGISLLNKQENIEYNYSYFPIFITHHEYGHTRNSLYSHLKDHEIFGRRYFYPLISNMNAYKGLTSSSKQKLPIANNISNSVICLPLYSELTIAEVDRICNIIKQFKM